MVAGRGSSSGLWITVTMSTRHVRLIHSRVQGSMKSLFFIIIIIITNWLLIATRTGTGHKQICKYRLNLLDLLLWKLITYQSSTFYLQSSLVIIYNRRWHEIITMDNRAQSASWGKLLVMTKKCHSNQWQHRVVPIVNEILK